MKWELWKLRMVASAGMVMGHTVALLTLQLWRPIPQWGFVALKKLYYLQKELISKETNNEHT